MRYSIAYICTTHVGNIRAVNEDNFICDGVYLQNSQFETISFLAGIKNPKDNLLLGVFDGMGGEECGEVASFIAAKNAADLTLGRDAVDSLAQFCKSTNEEICAHARKMSISSMGTTAAMLAFTPRQIVLCNIGDSKIFRCCAGKLEQISIDHIAVSDFGCKPPLSQNLGIPDSELVIKPYFAQGAYTRDDTYLICTDGLTDMISTDDISSILALNALEDAAKLLISKALANGGRDNITLILCRIQPKPCWLSNLLKK